MADDGFIYLRVCHKVVEGHGRPRQARHALKEIRETPSGRSASGGMKKVSLLVAALLLSVTTAAQAGALEDKELWERVQATIDSKAEKASKACDTTITASADITSFAGVDLQHAPIESYGRDAVAVLQSVCATPAAKKAVQAEIKKVTLRRGMSGTQVALAGGELVVCVDPNKTSISGKKPGSYSWLGAIKEVL